MTAPVLDRPATGLLVGVAYGRNSSDKDASIESQLRGARARSAPFGVHIPDGYAFCDGKGASRRTHKSRRRTLNDQIGEVVRLVESGAVDVVCVWEASRLDRTNSSGAAFIELCEDRGVKILLTSSIRPKMYDPRDSDDHDALIGMIKTAANESNRLGDRTKEGIGNMVQRGAPTGRSLFGYTRTFEGEGKDRVCVGQEANDDAAAVRQVFAMVAAGHTLTGVVDWLNQEGYKTLSTQRHERQVAMKVEPAKLAKPAAWSTTHVRDMIRNKAYRGERSTGEGAANWPAIVDAKVFRDANAVLDGRRPTSRPAAQKSLLTGVAICECGAPVRATTRKGQRLYACSGKGCVAIDLAELDRLVTDVVLAVVSRADVHAQLRRADDALTAKAEAAETELARLEGELDAVRREWIADRLSLAAYQMKEQAMLPKIEKARKTVQDAKVHPALRELVDAAGDVAARWAAMTWDHRRAAIRTLATVTVHPIGRGRRNVPASERVTIAPVGA